MPRKARIDTLGALHHIIVRDIERQKIFFDNTDRDNFLERLGSVLIETSTPCFAWALIPKLVGGGLVRSAGGQSVVKDMRRGFERMKGDERILGDGDFVEAVLKKAQEDLDRKSKLIDLSSLHLGNFNQRF